MSRKEEIRTALDAAYAAAPQEMIRAIAVSVASFIAEIDASSADVADYIERRLSPLARFVNVDERVRLALAQIAKDDRPPKVPPMTPAASPPGGERRCFDCRDPIAACMGCVLSRDVCRALAGEIPWAAIRELCGRCAERFDWGAIADELQESPTLLGLMSDAAGESGAGKDGEGCG